MIIKKILRVDIVCGECTESLNNELEMLTRSDFEGDESIESEDFNVEFQGQPFHDPQDGGFCQMVVFYKYIDIKV
jgi:hypothetical protein